MAKTAHERRLELHSYGATDRVIAEKLDTPIDTIKTWRRDHGLPVNLAKRGLTRKDDAERRGFYRRGYTDCQIARIVGVETRSIHSWRAYYNLPRNQHEGSALRLAQVEEEQRMRLYRGGASDSQIAQIVGRRTAAIFRWRQRRFLPANVRQREWDRPATTIVSMDADLGEGGFNRHAFIADDAAAEWLEEMGATKW